VELVNELHDCESTEKLEASSVPECKGQWAMAFDPDSEDVFYYHTRTKEVTWDRPLSYRSECESENAEAGNAEVGDVEKEI
jgi:hypothetical protein